MTKCDVSMPMESERTEVTRLLNKIGIKTGDDFILLSPFASSKERNWPLKEVEKLVELINKTIIFLLYLLAILIVLLLRKIPI